MRLMPLLCLLASPALAEDVQLGAQLFGFHCASCHGAEAKGDGPLGDMLTIRPPDLTTLAAQNDGLFPLEQVLRTVDGTMEIRGHGGPMPVFGFILDGPSVVMAAPGGGDVMAPTALADIASWLMSVQE